MAKALKKPSASLHEMQSGRLDEMNQKLKRLDLPLLVRPGNYKNGETELVRIVSTSVNAHYAVVEYETLWPDGRRNSFFIQYGVATAAEHPCVVVPVINGTHAVMLHSHRAPALTSQRSWFTEFPRGFVVNGLQPTMLDKKLDAMAPAGVSPTALRVTSRKLHGLLVRDDIEIQSFRRVDGTEDGLFQDTGRSGDSIKYWLLELKSSDLKKIMAEVKGPKQMQIRFVPVDDLAKTTRRNFHDIRGEIDVAAILLWLEASGRIT